MFCIRSELIRTPSSLTQCALFCARLFALLFRFVARIFFAFNLGDRLGESLKRFLTEAVISLSIGITAFFNMHLKNIVYIYYSLY